jgi:photosystem II stability/assembly factor-like uncharacterized protein
VSAFGSGVQSGDVAVSSNGTIYATRIHDADGATNGIYRSTDGGVNFTDLTITTALPLFDVHGIAVFPGANVIAAATAEGMFKSVDGGATWLDVNGTAPNGLAIATGYYGAADSSSTSKFYVTSQDVGLDYYSGSLDWSQLDCCTIGHVALAPNHTTLYQSDAVVQVTPTAIPLTRYNAAPSNAGTTDITVPACNGGNPNPPASGSNGYTDCFDTRIDQQLGFLPPMVLDPSDATGNTLYAGSNRVFVSHDAGAHWRLLYFGPSPLDATDTTSVNNEVADPNFPLPDKGQYLTACQGTPSLCRLTDSYLTAIAVGQVSAAALLANANTPRTVYAGDNQGRIWVTFPSTPGSLQNVGGRSTDGVTGWWTGPFGASNGLPVGRWLTALAVDPDPARTNIAYATYSGFNAYTPGQPGHVFKTTDFGLHWSDASANLPDVPVNAIVIDPTLSNVLYVGTDAGVYKSSDGGLSWLPLAAGLPRAAVLDLQLNAGGNNTALFAVTHGRAVWRLTRTLDTPPMVTGLTTPASFAPNSPASTSFSYTLADDVSSTVSVTVSVYDEQNNFVAYARQRYRHPGHHAASGARGEHAGPGNHGYWRKHAHKRERRGKQPGPGLG